MKKFIVIMMTSLSVVWGCNDEEFLNREPQGVLLENQIFTNEDLTLALVADFYNRIPDFQHISRWWEYANFDECFGSFGPDYWRHQFFDYGYGDWGYWDYGFVRELNLFLVNIAEAEELYPSVRDRFEAEVRMIRAMVYFEMVKRMGGVPLITEPLSYDYSGDVSYLHNARASEHEVYDFILDELAAIRPMLPDDAGIKTRATQGLAWAMQARVAVYAGSIAKHGASTPAVSTDGGEVGIPAAMADGYYQLALEAAQGITGYSLYQKEADLSTNFAKLFIDKNNNPEVIFAEDFKLKSGKIHGWTLENTPISLSEEGTLGGKVNPSLNLAQSYELLDNTFAPFATHDLSGDPIVYDNPGDIFAGRDARLGGTIILPGSSFKDTPVDIFAGLRLDDGSVVNSQVRGEMREVIDGQGLVQVVGKDGPIDGQEFTAQTGFFVRKYLDPTTGAGQIGTQSEVWWIRYRLAEVLLNGAEAAFELGQNDVAADFLKIVRDRAGLTTALTAGEITFDRIVHERRAELAFENHILWDMKRWRLAHVVWNGNSEELTNDPGDATATSTRVFGLRPYKIYNPGDPDNGKYIYEEFLPGRVTVPHRFRLGNYYSQISDGIRSANPLILPNPNQ